MSWLTVKLDDKLHIIEIDSSSSSGSAHRKALEWTDAGFKARVVPPEDVDEVAFLWDQMEQKKEFGFIEEYGHVPNGTRTPGDGVHTLGNMIYPAFGGMLEGVESQQQPESKQENVLPMTWHRFKIDKKTGDMTGEDGKPYLPFSSKESGFPRKKMKLNLRENGIS